jgi:hypothetical protein
MEKTMRKAFLCAMFVLFLPVVANAQSGIRAMQAFGLMGTWAGECKEGPSATNNHATYLVTPTGSAQLKNAFGEDYNDSIYDIVDARPTGAGKLSLRLVLASDDQIVLDVVILKENGKIRIWSSNTGDGKSLVKDGMIPAPVNRETRWVTHCE